MLEIDNEIFVTLEELVEPVVYSVHRKNNFVLLHMK